ncbi:MAG: DUF2794 domain-containing protein [Rhodobiaceae bacterium]|jgi:hypothetical protein|nr:DUF2794 domain-containing protein [Rhodobiaceae bacterium]
MAKTKTLVVVANAFEREQQRAARAPARIMWTRPELSILLNIYGRQVAAGHWRDYAMSDGKEAATFSMFRRASEVALYKVEKIPALRRKQGQYVLSGMEGRVLRRGHDLEAVLRFFERKNMRLID